MNSTLEFPEVVSDSYVTVFLSQLINDGYTVFMAKGRPIPVGGTKPFGTSSNSQIKWYTERELLMKGNHTAEQKFVAFSGTDSIDYRTLLYICTKMTCSTVITSTE